MFNYYKKIQFGKKYQKFKCKYEMNRERKCVLFDPLANIN